MRETTKTTRRPKAGSATLKMLGVLLSVFLFINTGQGQRINIGKQLQTAEGANYIILTGAFGEQFYIHRDSTNFAQKETYIIDDGTNYIYINEQDSQFVFGYEIALTGDTIRLLNHEAEIASEELITHPDTTLYAQNLLSYNCDSILACLDTLTCDTLLDLDIKVFLEGPYDTLTATMRNGIGTIIPAVQPYPNAHPFLNTARCELTDQDAVDWVLVKLRTIANDPASTAFTIPGLLKTDGTIVFCEENLCVDGLGLDLTIPYSVTVQHRNHIGIESHVLVSFTGNTLTHDFTNQNSLKPSPFRAASKQMADGNWVMYGGNAEAIVDFDAVNAGDNTIINSQDMLFGYLAGDTNMDGIVNSDDVLLFNENNNVVSIIGF